jgi:hypothetical protein
LQKDLRLVKKSLDAEVGTGYLFMGKEFGFALKASALNLPTINP